MKKLAQFFKTAAQDLNPGSLSRVSKALPKSHCDNDKPVAVKFSNFVTWIYVNVSLHFVSLSNGFCFWGERWVGVIDPVQFCHDYCAFAKLLFR